jgi:aminoglycoside 6'-N-acetyltransferase I
MGETRIRAARPSDAEELARMFHSLWPDGSIADHGLELSPVLAGKPPGTLPLVILVAEREDQSLAGFVEVGLRSHADGCDISTPVGYLEGWYVSEQDRRQRIGAELIAAAEDWARVEGCVEMASDTWIDSEISQRAHEALGFEVVDRCVHYRKRL